MKLTSPDRMRAPESSADIINAKIEEAFARDNTFEPSNDLNWRVKRVTIEGYYELEDCRAVCNLYRAAGWDEVMHRRVPFEKTTTFTFKVKI